MEARQTLLYFGTQYGLFRAASFTSEEIRLALELGMLNYVDLLAINRDEALRLADIHNNTETTRIVQLAVERVKSVNPRILVTVTAGAEGSWLWTGESYLHLPAMKVQPVSTAGAGDAHLAGMLVGIAEGMGLAEAHRLGVVVAGLSVTSPHTINKNINRELVSRTLGQLA
jgi:ribokinase